MHPLRWAIFNGKTKVMRGRTNNKAGFHSVARTAAPRPRGFRKSQDKVSGRALTIYGTCDALHPPVMPRLPAVIYSLPNYDPGICGVGKHTPITISPPYSKQTPVFPRYKKLYVQPSPGLYLQVTYSRTPWRFGTMARVQR